MKPDNRANAVIYVVVLLGAVVSVTSIIGYAMVADSGPATTESTTPTNDTEPAAKDVQIVFEQWGNNVSVAASGGADLGNVTSFAVENVTTNESLDPTSSYPKIQGTIDNPATVTVRATFADGTTQVVARQQFD